MFGALCICAFASLGWWTQESWPWLYGHYFFRLAPSTSFLTLLLENYVLWLSVNSLAFFLFYLKHPIQRYLSQFKFNARYPPARLLTLEFGRSSRGVFIATAWIWAVGLVYQAGVFPLWSSSATASLPNLLTTALPCFVAAWVWGECHFYYTHRLLHSVPWLYREVHKIHHESFNPDPFSGLSMHWAESAIYFSAFPLLALLGFPYWLVRVAHLALIVVPTDGHLGHGPGRTPHPHYLHHTKFQYNFGGGTTFLDELHGTLYVDPKTSSDAAAQPATEAARARAREAGEQEKLAKADRYGN